MITLKWYGFALCFLVAFNASAFTDFPQEERGIPVHFTRPEFSRAEAGQSAVHIEGLMNTVGAGLPSLPVKTFQIAIPAGMALDSVTLSDEVHETLHATLALSKGMIPLSWFKRKPRSLKIVAAPLPAEGWFPRRSLEYSLQTLHGVPIALVNVYPLRVSARTGELDFLSHAMLRVTYRKAASREVPALFSYQRKQVAQFVDNPEVLSAYETRELGRGNHYDYLIVTTKDLEAYKGPFGIADLQAGLSSRHLLTKVVDLDTIAGASSGRDLAEKIRNYIRNEYQQFGIQYVLLLGNSREQNPSYIPARRLNAKIKAYMEGNWVEDEENIPSDFYYACLDGSYNANGNDKWGEPDDGEGGADVDLLPEVNVGRMPVETPEQLSHFVKKTLWVYSHPLPKQVVLLGEMLFPELNLTGGTYMDQLIGTSTDHGFTTTGYSADWQVTKLYDEQREWSGEDAVDTINRGDFGMVNHLGHSDESYNMRLYDGKSFGFENQNPYFYYTQGCLAGRFIEDSIVVHFLTDERGPVAAVANASYGLAPEDPEPNTTKTPGASQMLHREFIDALFEKGTTSFGQANELSKQAFLGLKSAEEIRWVDWDANYLGDPSLPIRF